MTDTKEKKIAVHIYYDPNREYRCMVGHKVYTAKEILLGTLTDQFFDNETKLNYGVIDEEYEVIIQGSSEIIDWIGNKGTYLRLSASYH